MRGVVKEALAPGARYVQSIAEPALQPGHVRVRVAYASLCGTDRELVHFSPAAEAFNMVTPFILGHECSGVVVEVGDGVTEVTVGSRVALESHIPCLQCRMCRRGDAHNCENLVILGIHRDGVFAEEVVVPTSICFELPDGISLVTGALMESAGVAMHAVQRAGIPLLARRVVIAGAGPVGMVAALLARIAGAAAVTLVEPNPYRRSFAEKLGISTCEPHQLADVADGFDVAIDASGNVLAIQGLLAALDREAVLVTVGHPGKPLELDVAAYTNKKGVTIRGVFGRRLWDTWQDLSALLETHTLDLEPLVTHRLQLSEFDEGIKLLDGEACKVIFEIAGENA